MIADFEAQAAFKPKLPKSPVFPVLVRINRSCQKHSVPRAKSPHIFPDHQWPTLKSPSALLPNLFPPPLWISSRALKIHQNPDPQHPRLRYRGAPPIHAFRIPTLTYRSYPLWPILPESSASDVIGWSREIWHLPSATSILRS